MKNKLQKNMYTCMSCWFKTFREVLSESEICPICNYQDTSWWIEHPFRSSFKYDKSLLEYQKMILEKIPYKIKKYEWYERNILWRPIDESQLDENYEYLPIWKYNEYKKKYKNSDNYDPSIKEAQKYNPDQKVHLDM